MAAGGVALSWDVPPKNGQEVYFSHDLYEKYSLAPTLSELLLLTKRNAESSTDQSKPGKEIGASGGQESAKAEVKPSADPAPFQEPRVPYPYVSSLTEREQRRYLFLMSTYLNAEPSLTDMSPQSDYSQYLQMKEFVSKEVAEFLKFAQNAARACAKDYDSISEKASLYSEQYLSSCLGFVKNYPECYILHEVTSIMGGKFCPELTLKLEASLLALGKVNIIKVHFPNMPAQIQIPVNLKNESSVATPEQRASLLHQAISTDPTAEKLAEKYGPQVVLTSESLFTLLNNHGLNYKEQWELPVLVKNISVAGSKPARVVYIDPPLLKKEMTVREKNHLFHAFLADFHTTKQSHVLARGAVLDKPRKDPENPNPLEPPHGPQMQISDPADLDFETDVTELETFGSTSKALNVPEPQSVPAKPAQAPKIGLEELLKMEKRLLSEVSGRTGEGSGRVGDRLASADGSGQSSSKPPSTGSVLGEVCKAEFLGQGFESAAAGPSCDGAAAVKEDKSDNRPSVPPCDSDADEEPLVIDTENTGASEPVVTSPNRSPAADISTLPRSAQHRPEEAAEPLEGPNQETDVPEKSCQQLPREFKPVGQILETQTALLEEPSPNSPGKAEGSFESCPNPARSQTPLVVEASVASTVEPGQSPTVETGALPKRNWLSFFQRSQKGSLRDTVENHSEYDAPEQGNLVYKLFSLDDLLLLVRCSIQKVQLWPRSKKVKIKRHHPVYVLPKLEYQAFYGAEALTEGEICRLWTESLLHSNCSFVVAHIDALTSNLFLVEDLSAEDLRRRFGSFKPASSLNILQHILKTVTGLQEGSYLLSHAAGDSSVTIHQSCLGKGTRGTYNLHKAHGDLPGVPSTLSVPWVPLDPNIPLPYHYAQGRVPCTFSPRPAGSKKGRKMSGANTRPDAPNRRKQVSMEPNNEGPPPTKPFRKRPGPPAQNKATMRNVCRQASRGPNWNFCKQSKRSKDDPT
ncbi:little elongation complex subunit 2 isoform X2 [Sphaerodactylus townsendi]|uniref:little elongation complex subunit 2 isoform X2 n=1 Tax=Sphaerodactylus townsendi TaxID=933632 RepID=UPI0020263CBF|nr:little elongation complex subunit 2 isoform X2 [Sphaerodactylus townsendi]